MFIMYPESFPLASVYFKNTLNRRILSKIFTSIRNRWKNTRILHLAFGVKGMLDVLRDVNGPC